MKKLRPLNDQVVLKPLEMGQQKYAKMIVLDSVTKKGIQEIRRILQGS